MKKSLHLFLATLLSFTTALLCWGSASRLFAHATESSSSSSTAEDQVITLTTTKAVGETIKLKTQLKKRSTNLTVEGATAVGELDYGYTEYRLTRQNVVVKGDVEEFGCADNQISKLDVSDNAVLKKLSCEKNQLTQLDVTENQLLTVLNCSENQLTQLDVTENALLSELFCQKNQLTQLDVSRLSELFRLDCSHNQLTQLDATKNLGLWFLQCDHNNLSVLKTDKNTKLQQLRCHHNQLTTLDLRELTKLRDVYCNNNKIKSIALDPEKNKELFGIHCFQNEISREKMGEIVDALKGRRGMIFTVVNTAEGVEENNHITAEQVEALTSKGWKVYSEDNHDYGGEIDIEGLSLFDRPLVLINNQTTAQEYTIKHPALKSGSLSYNVKTKTLTFEDATIAYGGTVVQSSLEGLNIEFNGENNISSDPSSETASASHAVFELNNSTTISSSNSFNRKLSINTPHKGISLEAAKDGSSLVLKNLDLNITANKPIVGSAENKHLSITFNRADLTAQHKPATEADKKYSAVSLFKNITLNRCYIDLESGEEIGIVPSHVAASASGTTANEWQDIATETAPIPQLTIRAGRNPYSIVPGLTIMGKPVRKGIPVKGPWLKKGRIVYNNERLTLDGVEVEYTNDAVSFLEYTGDATSFFSSSFSQLSFLNSNKIVAHSQQPVFKFATDTPRYFYFSPTEKSANLVINTDEGGIAFLFKDQPSAYIRLRGAKLEIKGDIVAENSSDAIFRLSSSSLDHTGKLTGWKEFVLDDCYLSSPEHAVIKADEQGFQSIFVNDTPTGHYVVLPGEAPPKPEQPEEPVKPTPDQPEQPEQPVKPTPDQPEQPEQPVKPTPDQPEQPEQPVKPTPDQPEQPEQPVKPTPDQPEQPEQPVKPTPDQPEQPEQPVKPTPDQPEQPEQPVKPTPNQPEQPEQPAEKALLHFLGKPINATGNITGPWLTRGSIHYDAEQKLLTLDNAVVDAATDTLLLSQVPDLRIVCKGVSMLKAPHGFYVQANTSLTGQALNLEISQGAGIRALQTQEANVTLRQLTCNIHAQEGALVADYTGKFTNNLVIDNATLDLQSKNKVATLAGWDDITLTNAHIAGKERAEILVAIYNAWERYKFVAIDGNYTSQRVRILPGEQPQTIVGVERLSQENGEQQFFTLDGRQLSPAEVAHFHGTLIVRQGGRSHKVVK